MLFRISPIFFLLLLHTILGGNSLLVDNESSSQDPNDEDDTVPPEEDSDASNVTVTKIENIRKVSADPGRRPIELYEGIHYFGVKFRASISTKCGNVPKKLRGNVGSIDTLGSLVIIFAELNCGGPGVWIERHSWESFNVKSSLARETDSWTGPLSLRLASNEDSKSVTFHSKTYSRGRRRTIYLPLTGDCVDLPRIRKNRVLSLSFGSVNLCVVVYRGAQCTGQATRFEPGSQGVDDLSPIYGVSATISSSHLCSAADQGKMVYLSMMFPDKYKTGKEGTTGGSNTTTVPEMQWEVYNPEVGAEASSLLDRPPAAPTDQSQTRRKRAIRKAKSEF